MSAASRIKLLAFVVLAVAAPRSPAQDVREATTVQTLPDIEQEGDKYKICGIRVLFRDSRAVQEADIYDLTVAMIIEGQQDPVTVVRATEDRGSMLKDPTLRNKARLAPADLMFDIAPVRYRIGVRERQVKDDTLLALVDESKAGKAGAYGGPLMSQLIAGDPVIVFWSVSPDELRAFMVKSKATREAFEALRACMSGVPSPAN